MPKTHEAPHFTHDLDSMRWASEVIGAYGECGGVTCPWCATRQYPAGRGLDVVTCQVCGEEMVLPRGYDCE